MKLTDEKLIYARNGRKITSLQLHIESHQNYRITIP